MRKRTLHQKSNTLLRYKRAGLALYLCLMWPSAARSTYFLFHLHCRVQHAPSTLNLASYRQNAILKKNHILYFNHFFLCCCIVWYIFFRFTPLCFAHSPLNRAHTTLTHSNFIFILFTFDILRNFCSYFSSSAEFQRSQNNQICICGRGDQLVVFCFTPWSRLTKIN